MPPLCAQRGQHCALSAADLEARSLLSTPESEGAVLTRVQPPECLVGVAVWPAEEKRESRGGGGSQSKSNFWSPSADRRRGDGLGPRGL